MFGYINIDYAGCKKDRRSISEAVNLRVTGEASQEAVNFVEED